MGAGETPGEDDWLDVDGDLDEPKPQPDRAYTAGFLRRLNGTQLLTLAAAILSLVSLFLPWYLVDLVSSTYTITGRSPLFLGIIGCLWSLVVLLMVPLMTRRLGGFVALVLIVMGVTTIGQVATFATVGNILGWAARLATSSIDVTVVDTRVAIGAYMQVVAGLIVIAAGSVALGRSLSAEVRRFSK